MIKVAVLGFGRTGTMSLKAALEKLGFDKCYHFSNMYFDHPRHAAKWLATSRGQTIDWERLFDGYRATTYLPPGLDISGLLTRYPDIRFILTIRDPERWYRSTRDTLYEYNRLTWYRVLVLRGLGLIKPRLEAVYEIWRLQQETLWNNTFHGRFHDKEFAISVYEGRIEEIKRTVPSERLLVYAIKEGWEPLCRFLEVPEPDTAFPRLNDSDSFIDMRKTVLPWI